MTYERIVFMQGDDYDEAMDAIEDSQLGFVDAAIEYLAQWDSGDGGDGGHETPAAGTSDHATTRGDYVLTWNTRLGYIGLERIER